MSIAKVSRALTSAIDTIPSIVTTALITANRAENALNLSAVTAIRSLIRRAENALNLTVATAIRSLIRRAEALSAATGALGRIGITG